VRDQRRSSARTIRRLGRSSRRKRKVAADPRGGVGAQGRQGPVVGAGVGRADVSVAGGDVDLLGGAAVAYPSARGPVRVQEVSGRDPGGQPDDRAPDA
jgi:hypothetical protein